jgi:hypothetical protein
MIEILRGQIHAMRAQLNAMEQMLEGFSQAPQVCDHPESDWKNVGTFGLPDWRCGLCQARINEQVAAAVASGP